MSVLKKNYPVKFFLFASPRYWKDPEEYEPVIKELLTAVEFKRCHLKIDRDSIIFIDSEEKLSIQIEKDDTGLAVFIPLSGGVQQWMLKLSEKYDYIALANAYLERRFFSIDISTKLMELNAHPACTDLYANLKMNGKEIYWVFSLQDLILILSAWQAVSRLRNSRILQIGETEPWVINSCRDSDRFKDKIGTEIIEIKSDELYTNIEKASEEVSGEISKELISGSSELHGIRDEEVSEASKVITGMQRLLEKYDADGISLACFSMIRDMGVTGCIAMSYFNDSEHAFGACEGDLDAAVSLFLLKALGEDFIWMGNPIIYEDNVIDMTHCTSARSCCGGTLDYRLMPHHESGKSVALEVHIPACKNITLMRIGNDLNDLFISTGRTAGTPKLRSCRTQIRIEVPSTKAILENLMGTHLILCLNDRTKELEYCARFLRMEKRLTNQNLS